MSLIDLQSQCFGGADPRGLEEETIASGIVVEKPNKPNSARLAGLS